MLYDPKWEIKIDSKTKTTLINARKLIENPENWCREYSHGMSICAVHAIQKVVGYGKPHFDGSAEQAAITALGSGMGLDCPGTGVNEGRWNDTHTHAEVLAAFDRAIAVS